MKIRREPPSWVPGFFSPGESLGSSFVFFFKKKIFLAFLDLERSWRDSSFFLLGLTVALLWWWREEIFGGDGW